MSDMLYTRFTLVLICINENNGIVCLHNKVLHVCQLYYKNVHSYNLYYQIIHLPSDNKLV